MPEPTISAEEVEILAQEGDIQAKKDAGENLTEEEQSSSDKINTLKDNLKERFKDKESPEKTKEDLISLQAQKEHFRTKFGKSDIHVKELETKIVELEKANPEKKTDDKETRLDGIEFLISNRDVSKDEFDFISAYARGKGISLEDARESKVVKTWMTASREKSSSDSKVPGATSHSKSFVKDENSFKSEDTDIEMEGKFQKNLENFQSKEGINSGV